MNYASGLMLGMSLVQAAKGLFGGSASESAFNGAGGFGGRKAKVVEGMGMFGNNISANFAGKMKKSSANAYDFSSFALPQIQALSTNASGKNFFELVSALPGRRRYRASYISKEFAALMEKNLSKLEYVKTVEVNSDTGSVLFTFDEKDLDKIDYLAHAIKKRLFSDNYAEYKRDRKLNQIFYGSITKSVKRTLRHISHMIIKETHGLFDIRSLSSCLFMILGFRKVILNGEFPSGIQMIWWAVSLMRGIKIS